jgi:hypothetical protein
MLPTSWWNFQDRRHNLSVRENYAREGATPKRMANTHTRMLLMRISEQASLRISTSSQKK